MARRARTAAGLVAILATLAIVAAAVTALPPAAGAAAPLRPSRTAASSAAFDRLPAAIVVLVGTVRPVPHQTRPHPSSSAALHRSPRHAFRAAPPAGHPTTLLIVLVVPARGPRAPRCGAEWTDRFAVAGGDPVNRTDPSGEFAICIWYPFSTACSSRPWNPPAPVSGGSSCFNGGQFGGEGQGGSCPTGSLPLLNELVNYASTINGTPTSGEVVFELDIVGQGENCWDYTNAMSPLSGCVPNWFPYGNGQLTENNLVSNFQISADDNIVFIGNRLVNAALPERIELADRIDTLLDFAEPGAEIINLQDEQCSTIGVPRPY